MLDSNGSAVSLTIATGEIAGVKVQEKLQSLSNQLSEVIRELGETGNHRDRATKLFEISGYLHLMALTVERMKNEAFRKDPRHGLRRALTRHESIQKDHSEGHNAE